MTFVILVYELWKRKRTAETSSWQSLSKLHALFLIRMRSAQVWLCKNRYVLQINNCICKMKPMSVSVRNTCQVVHPQEQAYHNVFSESGALPEHLQGNHITSLQPVILSYLLFLLSLVMLTLLRDSYVQSGGFPTNG